MANGPKESERSGETDITDIISIRHYVGAVVFMPHLHLRTRIMNSMHCCGIGKLVNPFRPLGLHSSLVP